ncbi:MAG: flagellar biosynthetic protein FliQ [Gemmatimonadales bacterium]|nr:flagellar biosynthetic protein FliQ [Gemmatimonadales bacterium]
MTPVLAQELLRRTMEVALMVGAPLLAVALLVGIVVTILQTITSLQEQTLVFVPKLFAVGAVFLLLLPWMLRLMVSFLVESFRLLPRLVA